MASRIRIAIDCMGGDFGLRSSLPAAIKALSLYPDLDLTLVGDSALIDKQLNHIDHSRLLIVHTDDVVLMTDKPSVALRKKTKSSMRIAIDLLQQQKVDAVVSAGNTGALMAMGCLVLKTLPGIDRPAICSAVPAAGGHCYLLDLGANIESSAAQLHQFAIMGATLAAVVDGISSPRVALLNIGEEAVKGSEQVKKASALMAADQQLNYLGYIEGDGLFRGGADVVVADGFVGNVALKVCEGTARFIASAVKQQFNRSIFTRLAGLLVRPILKNIYQQLDAEQYNGASFLGLQGVLVKSHGASTVDGFVAAIARARLEVSGSVQQIIAQRIAEQIQ